MGKAIISDDGKYRYALWRDVPLTFESKHPDDTVLFVMLNPSTADGNHDDPTLRRCLGFAKRWGYGHLAVANLYAYRATDPTQLFETEEPVGPENDRWIEELAGDATKIIAAWGATAHPEGILREARVKNLCGKQLHCLALTQHSHPQHPLYVTNGAVPVTLA